ncbi:MAG: hypothetical protein R3264_00120, partial [Anaerolineae bacterium]|nr:hypothetical protein [Anaerolineae bacterium]
MKINSDNKDVTIPYDSWQHVAVTLNHNNQQYHMLIYLSPEKDSGAIVNVDDDPVKTDLFRPRQTLTVGQSDTGDVETVFRAQMSEFQLWNQVRDADTIGAERDIRSKGTEFGLFHLPLDGRDAGVEAVSSTLDLRRVFPAYTAVESRERILMFYGNERRTLRNNLEDANFDLILDSSNNAWSYDVNLTLSRLHLTRTRGLSMNDYATPSDSTLNSVTRINPYYLNLYRLFAALFPTHPFIEYIRQLLQASAFDRNHPLLSQLPQYETFFVDVNNQPGWYLLDTGDEQFLITATADNLQTTAQRIEFEYLMRSEDEIEKQQVKLKIQSDRALEVGNAPSSDQLPPNVSPPFKFEFQRLSTFAIHELSLNLFANGIDGLLSLESQQLDEKPFDQYEPNYTLVKAPASSRIDFNGAHGLYYWEIFFHIPFLIANQLNGNQKFAEAQQWYHYIFNPTAQEKPGTIDRGKDRYWRFLPFRNLSLETLSEILTDPSALEAYRKDPFDPHAIARLRINPYQKAVVMKYIDNLLDWGDYLFRQDTREAINEALTLYVLAFNLLGPRPKVTQRRDFNKIGDYQDVRADLENSGLAELSDFLTMLQGDRANGREAPEIPFDPNRTVTTRFCLPENEHFIAYWDRVEDRLYKIRHSLNIDGVFRSLALFQPPIDPAALVRAVGGGLSGGFGAIAAAANAPVPHYRYAVVIQRAKELAGQVSGLGNSLLSALEKKDGEELTLLRHAHELNIMNRTLEVRHLQKEQAKHNLDALKVSLQSATSRRNHYEDLLQGPGPFGSSELEIAQMTLLTTSSILRLIGSNLGTAAGILKTIPKIESGGSGFGGSPVATAALEGRNLAAPVDAIGKAFGTAGEI